ncbi:unnamed protein product [Ectocarpus fasciculatus]
MECKRSMDCTCPQCAAASAQFSVEDLKQFSSAIDYGEEVGNDSTSPPEPQRPVKPKPIPKRKPNPRPRPTAAPIPKEGDPAPPPAVPVTASQSGSVAGDNGEDGPLEGRLVSKNWKDRKAAYDQVLNLYQQAMSDDSDIFRDYAPFLKGMVQDSNASCLDAALDAVLAFADGYVKACEHAPELAPGIVAKGLSGRPGTVSRAEAVLLKLMEVDTPDVVAAVLLEGLSDKKPKVPPACVGILANAIQLFGARAMPLKDLKAALPGMLSHKVVAVRQQGLALAAEIISWCGEPMLASVISELRSAQKTDLDGLVKEKATGSPRVPTLYLRKDRPSESGEVGDESKGPAVEEVFDPREFIEPVDILSKLPKTEFNQKVAATKWSEILEGLNIAIEMIGDVPKLTAGDYGDMVQKLKRLGDHSHVQVASTSHRLLSLLAEGLGQGFHPYFRSILGAMLVKLKDKKCAGVLGTCLDRVYGNPHSLDQVVDEVVAALDTKKAIHARVATLGWISRCVAKSKPAVEIATLTTLAKATIRLVDDSDPKIREAGSATVAAIANASRGAKGPAPPVWAVVLELQTANARAFKRIQGQVNGAASNTPAQPDKVPSAPPQVQGSTGKSTSTAAEKSAPAGLKRGSGTSSKPPSVRARAATRGTSKAPAKPRTAPSSSAGQRKPSAPSAKGDESDDAVDDTVSITLEEAIDKLDAAGIEGWGESILPGLRGTAWKEKVASIERITQGVLSDPGSFLTPVVMVLAAHTKQFKDSNFNVLKASFQGITTLLEAAHAAGVAKGNQAVVSTVVAPAVEKLGDRKLQETTSSLLTSAAESFGPSWVARRVMKAAGQAKAPLVHSEALTWLHACVKDFGAAVLPAPQVVAFAVSELEHVNPKVRTSALELLGSMYHRLGPPMKALLPELRAALQSQVDGVFSKVGHDPTADAQVARRAPTVGGEMQGQAAGGGGLPRIDLNTLLEKDCLPRMQCIKGKDAWKGRKAAIEEVVQACGKSGNHLEANRFMVEVLKALTPRLADSQSNLKPLAASALAEVASSVGADSSPKLTRIYAEPLLACVADNRKMMRDAAITALEKVTLSGGALHVPTAEALIGPVVVAMTNTVGRIELLTWLKSFLAQIPSGEGPTSLVSPLLVCMQDKSAGARQVAQECLSVLVAAGTVQPSRVRAGTRDFQPAVMRQLKPALEKILENSGDPGSGTAEAADTAAPSAATQAAPPTVVSKLVRGGPNTGASSGAQTKRPSRSTIAQKVESASESEGTPSSSGGPLLSISSKAKRLESEKRSRWFVSSDEPRDHQTSSLKALWSPLLRSDAVNVLFPARVGSMECGTPGMELLSCALHDQRASFMDQLDLIFKWISLRLCEKENVKAMGQLLHFLGDTFDALVAAQYRLEDMEVDALLPTLLEKSGQAKERFRVAIRGLLTKVPLLCSYAKYSPLLLQATASKNSRTRIACLLELSRCIGADGPASALGKKGLKELVKHVDSDQAEVRSAALDAVEACYVGLDKDSSRIHRLLGAVNDKTKTLIDERMKASDRKNSSKAPSASQANTRGLRESAAAAPALPDSEQRGQQAHLPPPPPETSPGGGALEKPTPTPQALESTPARTVDTPSERSGDDNHRASLGGLGADSTWGDGSSGALLNTSSGHAGSDDEGPFRFDCNALEVQLSPRSRERETTNTAADEEFNSLLAELDVGLLQCPTLLNISPQDRSAAVAQIKNLSSWATAQGQRTDGTDGTDGETVLERHHSRLVETLVRCLRLSFTGSAAVADGDAHYAEVAGAGGIDLELAPQVVTALDDVCVLSPRSFDAPSLAALLEEVCLWLVEQRIGPRAQHSSYKSCDPYAQQVQHKLNRVATASGSANPLVAMSALLDVMANAYAKSAGRQEPEQVSGRGKRSLETKLLKVYVKLLARLLRDSEKDSFGRNDGGSKELGLPLVLRALHKYHLAEKQRDAVNHSNMEDRTACDAAQRLVSMLCERLCSAFGSSAVVGTSNVIREEEQGSESAASVEAWTTTLGRCLVTMKENAADRRHSSPVAPIKADHVAEIARLIGLVSAESQNVGDGSDGSAALTELKAYVQKWPEAQSTLEHQVDRLKPRFRQFILEGCKAQQQTAEAGLRSTPLRGRMADVHGSLRRGQAAATLAQDDGTRKSLSFDNGLQPGTQVSHADQDDTRSTNRLQEIRRRMGVLGARDAVGTDGGRPQPLKQQNTSSTKSISNGTTAGLQERLRRAQSKPAQGPTAPGAESSGELVQRFRNRNA